MAKTISTSAVKGRKTATGSKKVSDSKTILKRKREEVESDNDNGDDDEEENDDEDNNDDDDEDKDDDDDDGDSDGDDDEEEDEEEEVEEELPQRSKKSSSSSTKNTAPAKKTKKPLVKSKKVLKKQKKMLKSSGTSSSSSSSGDKLPKAKKMRKLERLEEARKAFKWWEAPELPNGRNWFKLEHAGINFAPAYVRHNIPFKYDGKVIPLNDEQEELASFYAAMPNDGPQLGNPKTRPVFQKNFFKDFKESFPAGKEVKLFEKCDFSAITEYLDLQKSLRKAANDEEKAVKKVAKETVQLKFGYALIDGRMEKVSRIQDLYLIIFASHFCCN